MQEEFFSIEFERVVVDGRVPISKRDLRLLIHYARANNCRQVVHESLKYSFELLWDSERGANRCYSFAQAKKNDVLDAVFEAFIGKPRGLTAAEVFFEHNPLQLSDGCVRNSIKKLLQEGALCVAVRQVGDLRRKDATIYKIPYSF